MPNNDDDLKRLESLIEEKRDLEDRIFIIKIKKSRLNGTIQKITPDDVTSQEEKLLTEQTDKLIKRVSFKERFCQYYKDNKALVDAGLTIGANAVVSFVKSVFVHENWYPDLLKDPIINRLAIWVAAVLIKKPIDLYCRDVPSASLT
ncbi:MAG: hypothetical protein AB4060_14075 [Crocosphaera sp.]